MVLEERSLLYAELQIADFWSKARQEESKRVRLFLGGSKGRQQGSTVATGERLMIPKTVRDDGALS